MSEDDAIDPDRDQEDVDRVGETTVRRSIDFERDVIVATAEFGRMFEAYLDHVRRWENRIDDLSSTFMRQGLGAATLHLSCRPPGEIIGWTINIRQPPTNVFLTGDSRAAIVTGRAFAENVKTTDASRMFVQVSRPGKEPVQSTVEVTGLDLFGIFEQYYEHSEQTPARFFELSETEFLMIHGLPDVDTGWLQDLSRDEALELRAQPQKSLGETTYRFQCGCNPDRMLEVVVELYRRNPDELFEGDTEVEILCPRCGRRWPLGRGDFEAAADRDES